MNIEKLINQTPHQLARTKQDLLDTFRFEDADVVNDYINHCITTGRLVKKILNA
jgi:hypothetical protein